MNRMTAIIAPIIIVGTLMLLYEVANGCEVASSAIKVTVKQEAGSSVYAFAVTNLHNESISTIYIRWNLDVEKSSKEGGLISTKIISPLGWRGIQANKAGHIEYEWKSYSADYDIEPGKTQLGFKLVMPELVDIGKLRFRVDFVEETYHTFSDCALGPVIVEK